MTVPGEKIALFIDGANLYATAKSLGFDIDYKRLLREFQSRGYLLRAFYYTAVVEDQEYSSIRPLIDWLDYNGYTVVTKATKEFVDQTGRRKVKGNMDIELAVNAMEIASHIDHMVLFSGDGDFRSLVEAVQRKGSGLLSPRRYRPSRRWLPTNCGDRLTFSLISPSCRQKSAATRASALIVRPASPGNRASIPRSFSNAARPHRAPRSAPAMKTNSTRTETRAHAGRRHPAGHLIDDDIGRDCPRCPRLVALRHDLREKQPAWHNAPVPSFGPVKGRLLIVGLAPGLQGANRTGRPFTGDYAGDLLYATLARFGFASGEYAARPDDGLRLVDTRITNAVRCVPPENKPAGEESKQCRYFLKATIAEMPNLAALVS